MGKDVRPRLEPRILMEDAELSYHAARRVREGDEFDNRVIFGDNLLALKALEAEFTGKVKCIYIDPPYNTGSAFTHYDDGLEHSLWLTMMRDRLEMLRRLLAEDGSIWISVDDNTDAGGITSAVNWQGGGGFRYFRLAPSLLVKDKYGNYVINREYNAEMLAEAMCKHQSFTYAPSDTVYWQHGQSSETDFLYVTTQTLTHDQLVALSEEVGDKRTLLICAAAFRAHADEFPNLTLKKIPNSVLHRCEWGKDDYSLQIAQLPAAPAPDDNAQAATPAPKTRAKETRPANDNALLFESGMGRELTDEVTER